MAKQKKLLIRLSSAGDVLLTSPLLRLLKEREPDAELHFAVKSQFADLIRSNPNVSRVHIVQDHPDISQLESLRRELIEEKFGQTLDLHRNFRSVYLRRETAPEIRVIRKEAVKRTILVETKLNLYSSIRSAALKYAQTYDRSITEVPRPEIYFPTDVEERIDRVWASLGPHPGSAVFLCPGARHFTKRWPAVYWRELLGEIAPGNRVVLLGGVMDMDACAQIQSGFGAVNLCGKLSLIESAAMLKHASVVVTNDSFLMHAANALGKRMVAIFGSSVREFGFYPYGIEHKEMEVRGLSCRPCSHVGLERCPKHHFKCMLDQRPKSIVDALVPYLESR